MHKKLNHFFFFMTVLAVMVTSAVTVTPVFADEGEPNGENQPGGEQVLPTQDVSEIIEQIPEGTELIVLSEDGIEPLASEAAAQIIIEGDPMWCPDGATPGDAGCTIGFATFQELIDVLVADNGTNYYGNGVIWVAGSYSNADDSPIEFNGDDLGFLGDLEFIGGWSGLNDDDVDTSDLSTLDVSLSVLNWTGNVSLSNLSIDAENDVAGLYVQTNGNITLNNVLSSGNSLGYGAALDTCLLDSITELCTGTGNVSVQDSTFDTNTGGSGLGVDSGGLITLDNVQANGNGDAGGELHNYDLIGPGGVTITDSLFDNNGDHGIWVQSDAAISLTDTDATDNGHDGVDLINYEGVGNVTVTGGNFTGNDEAGLYIDSAGTVTLASLIANDNRNGAVIFTNYGTGDVNVSESVFNDNTWTGLEVESAGNISLDDVDASGNSVGGVYLNALFGSGNISIQNTFAGTNDFIGNGQYGIHAFATGDITLGNVSVDGLGTSGSGAFLKSFEGDVFVSDSIFTDNLDYGLRAVAAGEVGLTNVTATLNDGNGVEIYSIYSYACFGGDNILITVENGAYTDNGGYGIYAYPGETGIFNTPSLPTFANNGLGDTFVEPLSNPCPEPKPIPEPGEDKPSNEVEVPENGSSDPVEQDCELFTSTRFTLHSGTTINVDCPFEGNSQVTDTPETELPDDLPVGLTFADAVSIGLDSDGNPITVLDDGLITLNFKIPEELLGKRLSILYWDPTAKDGQGDWIELPFDQFGGAYFPLYPDNPDDGRLLCSGFKRSGDTVTVTVNFPGTFVLVAR